jgi:signal transduction histidine kinase/CheY-like chemotaxis protein
MLPATHEAPSATVLKSTKRKRYRHFVPAAMVVCLVHFLFCLYYGLYPPGMAMITEFGFLWVCMFLYYKKLYDLAGFLTVASLDVLVIVVTYYEGLNTGGYLNFFPVIVASGFMANIHKFTSITFITIAFSLVSLLVSFFISDPGPVQIAFTPAIGSRLLLLNIVLNFGAVTWFSIIILLIQRRNSNKLIAARNSAEMASKAKSDFLSVMSHELRTPLNGIIGITHILNNEQKLPQQEEYLHLLAGSSNHMLRMVESLLQFNKLEAEKLELAPVDFNLRKLAEDACAQFEVAFQSKGLYFTHEFHKDTDTWLLGDDVKIIQVLNNLLSNALKFTESGGVTVKVGCEKNSSAIHIVTISVADTGIGIAEDKQYLVFEDFMQASTNTTRKFGGTGLGLTISKKLVELMGGKISLKSNPGRGSEFSVQLKMPAGGKMTPLSQQPVLLPAKENNGYTILVAEDNLVNAKVVSNFLTRWNLQFHIAQNGQQAVEQMKQRKYDMVLMDLDMPEVDGMAATATLRSLNYNEPIIAFTAAILERYELNNLYDLGFTDCIEKPFKPALLYEKLKKHSPQSIW